MNKSDRCAKCGACSAVCPVYQVTGRESLTARGKLHLLKKINAAGASNAYADILSKCLLCGACSATCPRQLDIRGLIIKERHALPKKGGQNTFLQYLSKKALSHPSLLAPLVTTAKSIISTLPEESGFRIKLHFLNQEQQPSSSTSGGNYLPKNQPKYNKTGSPPSIAYFPGCFANYVQKKIAKATKALLGITHETIPAIPASQTCCGLAQMNSGDLETAKRLAKKNIVAFEDNSLPILTSCASCHTHLKEYPKLLADEQEWQERAHSFAERLQEFSTFFNTSLPEKKLSRLLSDKKNPERTICYHDPCHLRFKAKITEAPRQLINRLSGIDLVELPHGPRCCGLGGLFHISHPDFAGEILNSLLADFKSSKTDAVVTTCSGCLLQWQHGIAAQKISAEAQHLAVLLAEILLADGTKK